MASSSQVEMKLVFEEFTKSLAVRFSNEIFTTEDSIRYTFFHCLTTVGGILPWEVILEYPHPVIERAKVDTYVPARNGRSALAVEFKFDRTIPSRTNQPRPQKAGAVFADIFRLALVPLEGRSDTRSRLYFVYVTDREMATYFQNPSNALQDFFNLAPDSNLIIDSSYVRRQSQTFVHAAGRIVDCEVANRTRTEFGAEFWLRVYEVRKT